MIHIIWILSILYSFLIYFFFLHYFHYNIYDIILISLHHTSGTSYCILFKCLQYIYRSNDRQTVNIHDCCFLLSRLFPTMLANISSMWSTNTKLSAIHWGFYYCYFVYLIVYCRSLMLLIVYIFCIHFALQWPKPTPYLWTLILYIV